MEQETIQKYRLHGQAGGAVTNIVALIVGMGVAVLLLIFVGALGGQTYNLVEPDIDNISDADIKASIKAGIKSSFSALEQTGGYLPIVALAVIIFLVLGLVLGFGAIGTGGGRTAL